MRDDEFEWDDAKATINRVKHNVPFDLARKAFADPGAIDRDEPDPSEVRYSRLCIYGLDVLVVVWTERGNRVRIISARRATKHEQRSYFEQ
jgi:uncharacterized DUF497 family protein